MNRPPRRGRISHLGLQAILAVAAVATAVALPVTLLSVGGGVAQHEVTALEQAGFQIAVSGAGTHGIANAHLLSDRIAGLTDVAAVSPILSTAINLVDARGGLHPALAEGVVPVAFVATEQPTERSLFPDPLPLGDPTDSAHFANGSYDGPATWDVLLSTPLATTVGLSAGSTVRLAPSSNASQAVEFNITGTFGLPPSVLGPTAADAVVLPLSDLQWLIGVARSGGSSGSLVDAADTIQVGLVGPATLDPNRVTAVANEIQAMVPYYGVTSLDQEAQQLEGSVSILDGFYLALSSVSLAVGFLFLAIVLVRRVEAVRASIAIRRAIGLPARSIAGEMIGQALLLAGSGGAIGVAGGIVVVEALARWGSPNVSEIARLAVFAPTTLALLFVGCLLLSLPASGLATRAALRLSVPEALR